MTYIIIDIETTGLSKHIHKITEIAAIKLDKGEIKGKFQTLVNPKVHIPSFITRLTGIDDNLVKDAPLIHDIMPDFLKFLGDKIFVAHNATFDYGFLNHNAKIDIENPRLCTRKLANRLVPDLYSKRLGVLCEYFKIKNNQSHRAMGDALATVELLNYFFKILNKKGFSTPKDILNFEKLSRKQILNLENKNSFNL
jgi:DNA polymerase III epsilon subunit family exonuclease